METEKRIEQKSQQELKTMMEAMGEIEAISVQFAGSKELQLTECSRLLEPRKYYADILAVVLNLKLITLFDKHFVRLRLGILVTLSFSRRKEILKSSAVILSSRWPTNHLRTRNC